MVGMLLFMAIDERSCYKIKKIERLDDLELEFS